MKRWREYFTTLGMAILCALFVRSYVYTAYKVPTASMQPSLFPGDFIFCSRTAYGLVIPFSKEKIMSEEPERGDLVVFTYPDRPGVNYVKRVIGLPGDRIQISKGQIEINEQPFKYRAVTNAPQLNPNSGIFEVLQESAGKAHWNIILSKEKNNQNSAPFIVPPNEIYLLGDNRDASDDSRYWGTVPIENVKGRVTFIWLSLDWSHKWGGNRYPSVRWERVFSSVY